MGVTLHPHRCRGGGREKKLRRRFYFWNRASIDGIKYFVVGDSCRSVLLRTLKNRIQNSCKTITKKQENSRASSLD